MIKSREDAVCHPISRVARQPVRPGPAGGTSLPPAALSRGMDYGFQCGQDTRVPVRVSPSPFLQVPFLGRAPGSLMSTSSSERVKIAPPTPVCLPVYGSRTLFIIVSRHCFLIGSYPMMFERVLRLLKECSLL